MAGIFAKPSILELKEAVDKRELWFSRKIKQEETDKVIALNKADELERDIHTKVARLVYDFWKDSQPHQIEIDVNRENAAELIALLRAQARFLNKAAIEAEAEADMLAKGVKLIYEFKAGKK